MSVVTSASTRRCYGVQRVCQAWQHSRSVLYARRSREQRRHAPAWRGPTSAVSDAALLTAVQADLTRSPFSGRRPSEGPRATARRGRHPGRAQGGVAGHAATRAALPAPRTSRWGAGP